MSEQPREADTPRYWSRSAAPAWQPQPDTPLRRFLGGAPFPVAIRLILVSMLVGALMMWLDVHPADVFAEVADALGRIWALGLHSLHDVGSYLVAGAAVVVPVWLLLRLFSFRGR